MGEGWGRTKEGLRWGVKMGVVKVQTLVLSSLGKVNDPKMMFGLGLDPEHIVVK